ncbi:hypothetical protein ABZZ47_35175 [Streptomyces sp. NPDC006465]|uniref:hypothetical protein n=1 Tax=Streptomyces sp. NPDC006465 TaxID=3157174 RepID=UPI0033B8D4FB
MWRNLPALWRAMPRDSSRCPVEQLEGLVALSGGQEGASVDVRPVGAQDRPGTAGEDSGALGEHGQVAVRTSSKAQCDSFEARDPRVACRGEFGDLDHDLGEGSVRSGGSDLEEQAHPARPQRPVAARASGSGCYRLEDFDRPGDVAPACGEPASHHGEAGVAHAVVRVDELAAAVEAICCGLGVAVQQLDGDLHDERVECVHAAAELPAEVDQGPCCGFGVVAAAEVEVLPYLGAVERGQDRAGAVPAVGPHFVEQELSVVVAVEELQGGEFFGELDGADERAQFPEAAQGFLVAALVAGGLADGVQGRRSRPTVNKRSGSWPRWSISPSTA